LNKIGTPIAYSCSNWPARLIGAHHVARAPDPERRVSLLVISTVSHRLEAIAWLARRTAVL